MESNDFLKQLREEMLQTRQRRFQCQITKITAIVSFIGLGALLNEKLNTNLLFYIVPFIAIIFDIFILGMSFNMRRLHKFLKNSHETNDLEKHWEKYVANNPDKYSSVGNLLVTVLCALGCAGILIRNTPTFKMIITNISFSVWFLLLLAIMGLVWWRHKKILNMPEPEFTND